MSRRGWVVLAVVGAVLVAFVAPVPSFPGNPPVVEEPPWDSPETRALAARACFDCHSNETKWPWYASVPPLKWIVRHHVEEARMTLNFSEWQREYRDADEAGEMVEEGEMPLPNYLWLHPEARLTEAERTALVAGLERTIGGGDGSSAPSADPDTPVPPTGEEEQFEHRAEQGEVEGAGE